MKRSTLARRTALKRSSPIRSRPKSRDLTPERAEWKTPRYGRCQACGELSHSPLHGHHVIARRILVRAGLPEFDPRNRMDLCETCHMNHEFGQANRKLRIEQIPIAALEFAVEVFGEARAADYLHRHYRCETTTGGEQ